MKTNSIIEISVHQSDDLRKMAVVLKYDDEYYVELQHDEVIYACVPCKGETLEFAENLAEEYCLHVLY